MDEASLLQLIERIIQSKKFGRSQAYARLLRYIVERSLQNDPPKESEIAMEVFGKDASFNPSENTLVRVYIHNLRKKIEVYYAQDGVGERYRLSIPKGKYEAVFSSSEEELLSNQTAPVFGTKSLILAGIILAVSLLFYMVLGEVETTYSEPSIILKAFNSYDGDVQVVLGDIFLFEEYDSLLGRGRLVRDAMINSEEELEDLIEAYPGLNKRQLSVSENPLLTKSQMSALASLLPLLNEAGITYSIKIMSRLGPEELYDGPVVFVGLYKTMSLLSYQFESSRLAIGAPFTELLDEKSGIRYSQEGNPLGLHKDIAYLSLLEGPGGHPVLILSSFTDTGILQLSNHLSNRETLIELEQHINDSLSNTSGNWELLMQVGGYNRINLESDLLWVSKR